MVLSHYPAVAIAGGFDGKFRGTIKQKVFFCIASK
jgi:hypothetical protein